MSEEKVAAGQIWSACAECCPALLCSHLFWPSGRQPTCTLFDFGSVSHNTTPHTLTFTLLNCWYHWLTQSTSTASRPSSRVLTPASVKWRTGAWLWSWRAREPTLYAANLFLCSARIHHNFCHPLYLSQSTTGLLWTPLQERCDSRNIKKMLLMRLQTFVVATDGCFCGFFHGWFII